MPRRDQDTAQIDLERTKADSRCDLEVFGVLEKMVWELSWKILAILRRRPGGPRYGQRGKRKHVERAVVL